MLLLDDLDGPRQSIPAGASGVVIAHFFFLSFVRSSSQYFYSFVRSFTTIIQSMSFYKFQQAVQQTVVEEKDRGDPNPGR